MGSGGSMSSGSIPTATAPGANLENWNVVRQKGDMYVYEMKNPKAALKPPERGQVPNSYVVMHHKASDKTQGVKSVTHYNEDGVRDYEIHTTPHKGLSEHYHSYEKGKTPIGDPKPLTPELQKILEQAKEI